MEIEVKMESGRDKGVDITIKDGNSIQRKCISLTSYLSILNESVQTEEIYLDLGRMPYGYQNGGISPSKKHSFWCSVKLPAQERTLLYYDSVYTVPFPGLYFCFHVENKKLTKSICYACEEESDKLYYYPFGNVHDDGKICWGNCTIPEVEQISDVEKYVQLFFSGSTNDDLWQGRIYCKGIHTQRQFLESLKGKKEFPKDVLIEVISNSMLFN